MALFNVVRAAGTPVLFLHGLTIDHRMLLPLDCHFATGKWQRHFVDFPGHGRSSRLDDMSSASVVDAVSDYIDANFAHQDFLLVGISYGGFIARSLHVRYGPRVIGAALISPAVRSSANRRVHEGTAVLEHDEFESKLRGTDHRLFQSFRSISPIHTQASWDVYSESILPGYHVHNAEAIAELRQNYDLEPYPEASCEKPLGGTNLLITGRQDSVVGWRDQLDLLEFYERQSYSVIEGAGHNVHLDQPAIVGHLIQDWLSKVR